MKIRITGLPAEVNQAVTILRRAEELAITETGSSYSDRCPGCGVRPGELHEPHCGARDSGEEIWPGLSPHADSSLICIYIQARLHPDSRAVP